ncbi:ABC transporter permease [Variovorax sp. efr-133-TYG-130]|uniref:ABC transporter permease n=1 Tax=Variovorax sp. efr-133-TYG-130 TaxID=3040327 RepID=UPI002552C6ED|nr:ABC transporter permease [Variovorax sp. efr-133-TYG-130]
MKALNGKEWAGCAVGIVLLWLILSYATGDVRLSSLVGILVSAAFLTVVSIGQAFTITTGRANIDLSVASMVTMGAFITTRISDGSAGNLAAALASTMAAGLLVGAANGFVVSRLRLPAIIVTLGVGYILATACQLLNSGIGMANFGPLAQVSNGWIAAIPVVVLLALVVTVGSSWLLTRSAFGHSIIATGQNHRAAELAGIRVHCVTIACFMISGCLAALVGAVLAARSGGAFLDMGSAYLIQSIGAVVIGGTAIVGGRTTFLGTMLGSVMLVLLVTVMQVFRLPTGIQEIIQGIIITFILLVSRLMAKRARTAA